jgi:hypothetical protein
VFVGTRKDLIFSPAEHLKISTLLYSTFHNSLAWPFLIQNKDAEGIMPNFVCIFIVFTYSSFVSQALQEELACGFSPLIIS